MEAQLVTREKSTKVAVSFRMDASDRDILDEYASENGYKTRAEAVEHIVTSVVRDKEGIDQLGPMLERVEASLVKALSRGTKAAMAAMCIEASSHDPRYADKLAAMNPGELLDWAWAMAGRWMSQGKRPDFYAAEVSAKSVLGKVNASNEELVAAALELGAEDMIARLSAYDVEAWAGAYAEYDATKDRLVGANSLDRSVEGNRQRYAAAVSTLSGILRGMGLTTVAEIAALADIDCAVWEDGERYEASASELAERRASRVQLLP